MEGTNTWGPAPAHPPTVEGPMPPVEGATAAEAVAAPSARVSNARNERRSHRGRRVLAAATLVGALFVGNHFLNSEQPADIAQAAPAPGEGADSVDDIEVCPAGMFPEGAYEATIKAFGNSELHQRPEGDLDVSRNIAVVDYLFGDAPGVACRSALTEAGLSALYSNMAGAGNAGAGFENIDINSLANTYKNDTEKAKRDAPVLARAYAMGQANEEQITGPYFRLGIAETPDADGNPTAEYIPEAIDAAPGEVYVVNYADIINDGDGDIANRDQKVLIDKHGQVYALQAIGAPVREEKPAEEENQDDQTGGGSADQQSQGGGDNTDQHNGTDNGCNGGCGEGGTDQGTGTGEGTGGCGNNGCGGGTGGGDCGCETPATPPATGGPQPTNPPIVVAPPEQPEQPPVNPPVNPPVSPPKPPKDNPDPLPEPPVGYGIHLKA